MTGETTNFLINESSPYLLMHAHNPVDWHPYGEAAFAKAKKENKPVIISIGYAACHWCHVMEQESFEDTDVARVMNDHFISIKVDREERPDIDQVYMDAAQLITGRGGWPLNALTLPDGRPFYAGTYFPKETWVSILQQIHHLYQTNPEKIKEQADAVTRGIRSADIITRNPGEADFQPSQLHQVFAGLEKSIDFQWGGFGQAPKFPLPVGIQFLLKYYHLSVNERALQAVKVALDKMAMGGIYDQVGGGFARYSTDKYWKVPHFEKMLYDNAQLVSLYSAAYQATRDPLYKEVVYETLGFIERELTGPELPGGGCGFYSSLDADSEGKEGKYYTWTYEELKKIKQKFYGDHRRQEGVFDLVISYFNITDQGNWEEGRNILFRSKKDDDFAKEKGIPLEELRESVMEFKKVLLEERSKRVGPPLDNKIITAWNALMLQAYVDAYRVFDEKRFLEKALQNAAFLKKKIVMGNGRLNRIFKEDRNASTINAFLDDYAFTIQAFIALYQATFSEEWLFEAEKLLLVTLEHFYDKNSGMFYFTSDLDPRLIDRKKEIADNVIPASNSVMALNLYKLGEYFFKGEYIEISAQMLNNVKDNLSTGGSYFANWADLLTYFTDPPPEMVFTGDDCIERRKEIDNHYLPHLILSGGKKESKLPLLKNKCVPGRTAIYVCRDKTCHQPVTETADALRQILSRGVVNERN